LDNVSAGGGGEKTKKKNRRDFLSRISVSLSLCLIPNCKEKGSTWARCRSWPSGPDLGRRRRSPTVEEDHLSFPSVHALGPWPSAITGIARRTMGTRQRARPPWLRSPRPGGGSERKADDHLVGESRAASTELQTECPGGLSVAPEQALGPLGKRSGRYVPARIVRGRHLSASMKCRLDAR
jgi:hypothetical protein